MEVYNVKIGTTNGLDNFFRVNIVNNKTYFSEQAPRLKYIRNQNDDIYCPISVADTFDNSLFSPFLTPEDNITMVAAEACRTFELYYKETGNKMLKIIRNVKRE